MSWIQTFTGRRFHPLTPRAEDVCIEDIAHALANQCRFSGHVRHFYSVAQHSVLVSDNCPPEDRLWGLLHDAAEAYLVDLPRPVKQGLRANHIMLFDNLESSIMSCVCARFQLPHTQPESVDKADVLLLATEARDLMAPLAEGWTHTPENGYAVLSKKIKPMNPVDAEHYFLKRFRDLR